MIAKNMYAQVDDEGNQYQIMDEIIKHRKDDSAVLISEGFTTGRSGNWMPKVMT